jgi:collagenase-like PrtC family protease
MSVLWIDHVPDREAKTDGGAPPTDGGTIAPGEEEKNEPNFAKQLAKLGDLGVRRVTVSTPFLLELVKRRFPEFKVRVGIYAQVDTPRRARYWEELGADAITLESFSINRDFHRLAAIRQAVHCDLQLIANHACLLNCPLQSYHQNGFAHASDDTGTLFIDYCFLRCSRLRLTDPSLFIKAAWIRPEDLAAYEQACAAGRVVHATR